MEGNLILFFRNNNSSILCKEIIKMEVEVDGKVMNNKMGALLTSSTDA